MTGESGAKGESLLSVPHIKNLLSRLGVTPSKQRGQNFLIDVGARDTIVDFATEQILQKDHSVLEVGPGLGVLTEKLVQRFASFYVLEKETAFCGHLEKTFPKLKDKVFHSDIRNFHPAESEELKKPIHVVSNVPYSISTDLVLWLIEQRSFVATASLLLQREFAERVAAEPGSRAYGSLSVYCTVYMQCSLGPVIGPECFFPEPAVDSRLIALKVREQPLIKSEIQPQFEKVVREAFRMRRKTLLNNIHQSPLLNPQQKGKEELKSDLWNVGIDPQVRPEGLSVQDFERLTYQLST